MGGTVRKNGGSFCGRACHDIKIPALSRHGPQHGSCRDSARFFISPRTRPQNEPPHFQNVTFNPTQACTTPHIQATEPLSTTHSHLHLSSSHRPSVGHVAPAPRSMSERTAQCRRLAVDPRLRCGTSGHRDTRPGGGAAPVRGGVGAQGGGPGPRCASPRGPF